jgi:hypothetical protein
MKKGYKFTEEQKAKRYSQEIRDKISNSMKGKPSPFKGITNRYTDEQKKKIGDFFRGRKQSAETIAKKSAMMKGCISPMKGRHHTEEHKQKLREKIGELSPGWRGGKFNNAISRSQYSVDLRRLKNGFTKEIFEQRLREQNNKCAICNCGFDESVHMKKKAADHCHTKNIPRGILCRKCNVLLGNANDNISILSNAITYLNYWEQS